MKTELIKGPLNGSEAGGSGRRGVRSDEGGRSVPFQAIVQQEVKRWTASEFADRSPTLLLLETGGPADSGRGTRGRSLQVAPDTSADTITDAMVAPPAVLGVFVSVAAIKSDNQRERRSTEDELVVGGEVCSGNAAPQARIWNRSGTPGQTPHGTLPAHRRVDQGCSSDVQHLMADADHSLSAGSRGYNTKIGSDVDSAPVMRGNSGLSTFPVEEQRLRSLASIPGGSGYPIVARSIELPVDASSHSSAGRDLGSTKDAAPAFAPRCGGPAIVAPTTVILVEATLSGKDDGSAIGRPGWQHRSQELPPESAAEEDREPGAFLEAADANPAIVISAGDSIEIQDGASAVRESSPARQIISRLAEMSNSEAHPTQPTLRIKLSPEYLGHVEIVLRGQGRALKLRIEAESGLAAELLLQDKEELGRAIRRHGLGLPDEMIVITQREATETSPLGQQSTDWRPGQDPGFGSKNHRSRQHQDASEALPEGRGKGGSGHANLSTTESSSFHRPGRFV